MRGKALRDRRARLRALAEQEAAARCAYGNCRQPLPKMLIHAGIRFCDAGCERAEAIWRERLRVDE